MPHVRLIKHEAVPKCRSFEVRFPDGRPSKFIYWEDIPGRRLRPEQVDRTVAERVSKIFARAEQRQLDLKSQRSARFSGLRARSASQVAAARRTRASIGSSI